MQNVNETNVVSPAAIAAANAQAETATANVKAKRKPATKAKAAPKPDAKPVKTKPDSAAKQAAKQAAQAEREAEQAKRADAITARQAELDSLRAYAATFYAGASNVAHKSKARGRDEYASRALQPVQIANSLSVRDEAGLALILSKANGSGVFDPVSIAFDLGVLSRLASRQLATYNPQADTFTLTQAGLSTARGIVKRARDAQAAKQAQAS